MDQVSGSRSQSRQNVLAGYALIRSIARDRPSKACSMLPSNVIKVDGFSAEIEGHVEFL